MGLRIKNHGKWEHTKKFLHHNPTAGIRRILEKYGAIGVEKLAQATPVDTGLTADSWYYQVITNGDSSSLYFCNANVNEGVPIAIILQYGHSTSAGTWVEGIDYINPALQPIFDALSDSIRDEVNSG